MGNCIGRQKTQQESLQIHQDTDDGAVDLAGSSCSPMLRRSISAPQTPSPILTTRKSQTGSFHLPPSPSKQSISEPRSTNITCQYGTFDCLESRCNSVSEVCGTTKTTFDFLNGGYWPSWKYYDGVSPSCVPLNTITHINYAFANIDGDGTVYLADEKVHFQVEVDGANGCLRACTQQKRNNPRLKVTLAIGGGGKDTAKMFAKVAANRQKLFVFTQSIKRLVDKFDLDGVDIDWEHPTGTTEARLYLQMLSDVRRVLGWHRWVTTALPAAQWALRDLDLAQIAKIVDFINLMAYDFVGPTFANVSKTGHQAQLFTQKPTCDNQNSVSGAAGVNYLLSRGVPERKIMLGIPAYGRVFEGANAPNQSFEHLDASNDATYDVKDLPRQGTVEVFDQEVVAAYGSGNGEFITYDNKDCVQKKAEYVKEKGLRGLFYWHLAGDRYGDRSLVGGGYEVLCGT